MDQQEKLRDEEIAREVQSGNTEAYAQLIERYQRKLLRYATNLLRDEALASGAVQDSFVKAFIHINGFNTKKKFSSWIYRIVRNESLNVLKKYSREVQLPEDFDIAAEDDAAEEVSTAELQSMVKECLGKMPDIYAEPLILFYLDSKSYDEISDIMRLSVSTVGTRIRRARSIMKKICQKN